MNLESKSFQNGMNSFVLKALVFIFLTFLFANCVKEPIPANIPAGAKFEKQFNAYVFTEPGRRRIYYDNGKIYQDCEINELGIENGICKFYSKYDDRLLSRGRFENGVRRGEWNWNFDNGNPYIRQSFGKGNRKPEVLMSGDEGNEEGSYERFYVNGQVELKGSYLDGYRNNLWQKFYPDGELEYTGYYKNGRKIRTWFYYYPTHKTEAIEVFDESGDFLSRTTFLPDGTKNCEMSKGSRTICETLASSKK
jgi:antitoxin component YwqK of YwqJK toxin-antitoxin module